ncbi:MAG: DUF6056 family protein [Clostridiales bacterium]|nr:DUF6056 family protein [Clostridiales bacterium]
MQKVKTISFWKKIIILILIISLIPILGLSFFNHSSADDYSYGCLARYAWVDSHNLLNVLKAVGEKIHSVYFEWQGSYAGVALFALQPAVFGEQFYVLVTYIIILAFLFSTFYFFRKLTGDVLGGDRRIADIVAGIAAILSIQMLPSPVEGLFWWNGASYYVIFYSLMLLQTANMCVVVCRDKCTIKQLVGLLCLAVLIAGGNYVSALLTMELTVLLTICSFCKRKKVTGKLLAVFGVTLAGFLVNCLAPGNAVRQASFEAWSPVRAILYSFHEAYRYMVEWSGPLLLLGLVFLMPFLWRLPIKKIGKGVLFYPLIIGIGVCLFASSFTPTLYAYGAAGAGRIQNIRYFLWIVFCILAEFSVICWIKQMIDTCEERTGTFDRLMRNIYTKYAIGFFALILFCGVFFAANLIITDDGQNMTSILAAKSLLSGEARQYDREMKERIELLLGEENKVTLAPLSAQPELLLWEDIKEEPSDWVNTVVAKFYRKDEVVLQKKETERE